MHSLRSLVIIAATAFATLTAALPAAPPHTLNNGNGDVRNAGNGVGAPVTAPNTAQGSNLHALNGNNVYVPRENVVNNGNGYIESDRNIVGLRDVINNGNGHMENDDNVVGLRRNVYTPNNGQNSELNVLNGHHDGLSKRNVYTPNNGQNAKVNILNRRACESCKSLPDVFENADVNVKALIEKCKTTVAAGPIKAEVAISLLADVKLAIQVLIADINAVVKLNLDVDALLTLNGKVLTVDVCAKGIVNLVLSICAAIQVIVNACVKVDLAALVNVVGEVGILLAALLKVCISVIANSDVAIAAAVKASIGVFVDLKLQAVVDLIASVKA